MNFIKVYIDDGNGSSAETFLNVNNILSFETFDKTGEIFIKLINGENLSIFSSSEEFIKDLKELKK